MNTLNCRGKLVDLSIPLVMGILNATPDSFFDGGMHDSLSTAMEKVNQMVEEGADIIDVGGMSSRPGAKLISEKEEMERVLPIIKGIKESYPNQIISIDTVYSSVAREAISHGAHMVNDISAGTIDAHIWQVCKEEKVPYILMHMQGNPENMQTSPKYDDVVMDILSFLKIQVEKLKRKGLKDIIVDPGFGFGKTVAQNFSLLKGLSVFRILDCPVMVGISRKSMLYKSLDITPQEALNSTTAAHMVALQNGAKILRVHDVKEAKEAVKIFELINAR